IGGSRPSYSGGATRRFFAHSISVARSPAGRNLYGAGRRLASWRSRSTFEGRIFPTRSGAKWRSWRRAAAWNVEARTPLTPSPPSRARSSPAALSVNVTARICGAANAPDSTWCAIRWVIVVVLPEPAPARMHTGPRTASAARRWSAFRPSRAPTRPPYREPRRAGVPLVQRVFEDGLGAGADRLPAHRAELRHHPERVGVGDEPLELAERLLEPLGIDRGAGGAHDLGVRGGPDHLAVVPEHLVHLLAGPRAGEDDRDLRLVAARQADHLLCEIEDADRLAHVEHVHLPAAAHRPRLHDERRGLGDRHEEARHLGVRDGDGPARS